MRYLVGCLCAAAIAGMAWTAIAFDDEHKVSLMGCLIRGDHGYLLTNAPGELTTQQALSGQVEPGPIGTSGAGATMFYWLDDDHDLAKHAGQQVEVRGELKGDVKPGEIKIEPRANWTDLEIKSNGRSLKAAVPTSLWIVSRPGIQSAKVSILVRRVESQDVRMLGASCE